MIVFCDVNVRHFHDHQEVEDFLLDRTARYINPGGTHAMAYFLGPGTEVEATTRLQDWRAQLRIDLDPGTNLGAARWFDGNLMAVDPGRRNGPGFGTWTNKFEPVPYTVAHLDSMTALRLAVEYARTGQRPTVPVPVGELEWTACDWMD